MQSKVAVIPCDSYDPEQVKSALSAAFSLLGGIRDIFREEEQILLKPNLVGAADPKEAVVTDPAVVQAVISLLKEAGFARLCAGDSGGFRARTEKTAKQSGLDKILREEHIPLLSFEEPQETVLPDGNTLMIAREALQADALISISKMKTHALERITGAVKNQYGCVSGSNKAMGHTRYPNPESFAHMLTELNLLLSPRLYIMDGILAMEGNGPTSGDPVSMNVLLVSRDPIALDTVFCYLIDLDPALVPTNIAGKRLGLGTYLEEEIEIQTPQGTISRSDLVKQYGNPSFRVDRKKNRKKGPLDLVGRFRPLQKKPVIDRNICRHCGVCVNACPLKGQVLTFKKGKDQPPVYNYRACIRCFCCQEMCPYHAIYVK